MAQTFKHEREFMALVADQLEIDQEARARKADKIARRQARRDKERLRELFPAVASSVRPIESQLKTPDFDVVGSMIFEDTIKRLLGDRR